MHIHGDDAAQSARDSAEGELCQNQPGEREVPADHSEHEISEHDGENPAAKPLSQPFSPRSAKKQPKRMASAVMHCLTGLMTDSERDANLRTREKMSTAARQKRTESRTALAICTK